MFGIFCVCGAYSSDSECLAIRDASFLISGVTGGVVQVLMFICRFCVECHFNSAVADGAGCV